MMMLMMRIIIVRYRAEDNILLFVDFLKQRVIKKEIAPSTVGTYFWPIKTFYDAHGARFNPSGLEADSKCCHKQIVIPMTGRGLTRYES